MTSKFKLLTAALAIGGVCAAIPAMAVPLGSGDNTVVSGRADVRDTALGTYIMLHGSQSGDVVAGFVPWSDRSSLPDLAQLDGRQVAIKGVVGMDGMPLITVTGPSQIEVMG